MLAALPHLTGLTLLGQDKPFDLATLPLLPHVNRLTVRDIVLINTAALAIHPRLTDIALTNIVDPDLTAIAALPHINRLFLREMPGVDLSPLQANPGIRVTVDGVEMPTRPPASASA